MKIRMLDGNKTRNTISPDFGIVDTPEKSPYVPKGEVWFDRAYRKEYRHFMKMHKLESSLMKRGVKFSKVKEIIRKTFVKKTKNIPEFTIRAERKSGFLVRIVKGPIVRLYIDPKFLLGGHGYVYGYIPKNEIWLDNTQGKKEMKYTLVHELHELKLIKKGMDYDSAHDFALAAEKYERRKDGAVYLDD
ncbi:MAG: hypothetical protein QME12_03385 [Nanoarchaeota archaeon]|nr:hypothetical protein [Nanoarchaeota archaeon]